MKRLILIAAFVLSAGTLAAQNYIIVNSEKVFKSIDAYNTALSTLDKLAEQYQDMVDAKFAEVETLYNNYMNQKASLTAATRQTRENDILAKEKAAQEYQETLAAIEEYKAILADEGRILAIIKDEHHSMASVIKGLLNHVTAIRKGDMEPDVFLFAAMFDYIEAYPDRLHHPKEDDYLFPKLRSRSREAAELIDTLEDDDDVQYVYTNLDE